MDVDDVPGEAPEPTSGPPSAPTSGSASVLFFHDRDATLWDSIALSLESFAEACEAGRIDSGDGLLTALKRIRSLTGCRNSLRAFSKAWEKAPERGVGEPEALLRSVAPFAARLAAKLPALFPVGLQILTQRHSDQVFLTRRQCGALLSAALFGAIPSPKSQDEHHAMRLAMPGFDLSFVLDAEVTKSLCLMSYLWQLASSAGTFLEEVVSFGRRVEQPRSLDFWRTCAKPLSSARVEVGSIEASHADLQADFANEFLGGGVLQGGNVQEEIRFSVCPECLVGMLFCEKMLYDEVIFIVGAQQFSRYKGYGGSFAFDGPYTDVPRGAADKRNRVGPHIVALDALVFPGNAQYQEGLIHRELTKAYAACLGDPCEDAGERRQAFATGNWGCGVFGGDPQLKSLIQWLAASVAERDLLYFPYGDDRLAELAQVIEAIQQSGACCRDLYRLLTMEHQASCVFKAVLKELQEASGKPPA
mmetsp:Transcript_99307/g.309430  ORF Transcript_99307/g.309430 Transcript_99307/m.309430 type:complete len:475 (-) Transcript_99307:232-1656(-)